MTFEADFTTVLQGVVARTFPDFAPVTTQRPYATWQQIGGDVINPLDGSAPGKRTAELQVSVWANTRAQAMQLARAIEGALRAATAFQARPVAEPIGDFEADVPVYGTHQDFRCIHTT